MKRQFLKRVVSSASALILMFGSIIPAFADGPQDVQGKISFPGANQVSEVVGGTTITKDEVELKREKDRQPLEFSSDPVEITDITTQKAVVVLVDSTTLAGKLPDKPNPFDFAMFNGDTDVLNLQGTNINITGNVHSNGSLKVNYSSFGSIGATSYFESVYGTTDSAIKPEDLARFKIGKSAEMPPLDNKIKEDAEKSGNLCYVQASDPTQNTYVVNYFKKKLDTDEHSPTHNKMIPDIIGSFDASRMEGHLDGQDMPGKKNDVTLKCETTINPDKTIQRKYTISSGEFNIDNKAYFFDGDLDINNSLHVTGKSYLIVNGDITFEGKTADMTDKDSLMVYSTKKGGAVNFTNNDVSLNGIVYAPYGTVRIAGSNSKINGSVIALHLNSLPNGLTLNYKSNDFETKTPTNEKKMKFNLPEAMTTFMQSFEVPKGVPTLMGIYPYDLQVHGYKKDPSDKESFELFDANDVSTGGGRDKLIDAANNIDKSAKTTGSAIQDSNLGDGLRMAYNILSDTSKVPLNIPKYVIVMSASVPNARTVDTSDKPYYDKGVVGEGGIKSIQEYKDGSPISTYIKDIRYSEQFASKYADNSIRCVFINCLSQDGADATLYKDVNSTIEGLGKTFYNNAYGKDSSAIKYGDNIGLGDAYHYNAGAKSDIDNKLKIISGYVFADKKNMYNLPISSIEFKFNMPTESTKNHYISVSTSDVPYGTKKDTGNPNVIDVTLKGEFRLDKVVSDPKDPNYLTDNNYIIKQKDDSGSFVPLNIKGLVANLEIKSVDPDMLKDLQKSQVLQDTITFGGQGCEAIVTPDYYTKKGKASEFSVQFSPKDLNVVYKINIQ